MRFLLQYFLLIFILVLTKFQGTLRMISRADTKIFLPIFLILHCYCLGLRVFCASFHISLVGWCDIQSSCFLPKVQKIHMSLSVLPDTELELESMLLICQATQHSLSTAYKSFLLNHPTLHKYSSRYEESYWFFLALSFGYSPWSFQLKLFIQTGRAITAEHLTWISKYFWERTVCSLSHKNN